MLNSTECAVSPDLIVHHIKVVWYTAHKKTTFFSVPCTSKRSIADLHTRVEEEGLKGKNWSPWFIESQSHWNREPQALDISYLCCPSLFISKETEARRGGGNYPRWYGQCLLGLSLEHRPPDSQSSAHCLRRMGMKRENKKSPSLKKTPHYLIPAPSLSTQITPTCR